MINNVTQIASPYTKTATKVNDSSTLNASEWNAISDAVETAHAKINALAGENLSGDAVIKASNEFTVAGENKTIVSTGTTNSLGNIVIGDEGNDSVTATINIQATQGIAINSTGDGADYDITFTVDGNSITVSEIMNMLSEWAAFKTNNSSLNFQSAA